MSENTEKKELSPIDSFKWELAREHFKTLVNFMKSEDNAKKFMSAVIYSVQRTPKLLECDRTSLMNAFMTCAEFWMFPSSASQECYVIPYEKKKKVGDKWVTDHIDAQFQLWYQWIVTLLYRAWVQSIRSEIIRKNDVFRYVNGELYHEIDILKSNEKRWEPVACYVVAKVNWQEMTRLMNGEDILKFKEFSKSKLSEYSPWNSNDPELNMWRKTVIKQIAKTLPKNESFAKAIEKDNSDSIVSEKKILETPSDEILNEKLAWFEAQEWAQKSIS